MNKKLLFIPLLFISLYLSACCSCGSDNVVNGMITVIGNEPFARLALRLEDNKAFVLECDKETEKYLLGNQGKNFAVKFKDSKIEQGITILIVETAVPINKNSN